MYSRNFFKVIGTVIVFLILSQQAEAQLLDRMSPRLRSKMNSSSAAEQIRIIILMQEHRSLSHLQALTAGMSKQDRRQTVVAELKGLANASQAALSAYLSGMLSSQKVADIRQLWAINGIAALATASVIEKIAKFDRVKQIILDPLLPNEAVQDGAANKISTTAAAASISWGVQKINAPAVWDLGYKGQGVLVGIIDTGVDYNHPDLENRMWDGGPSYPNHGYDFGANDNDPMDVGGHGTNVAGIVAGDGAGGTNQTGVAPEVTIMAIKVVDIGLTSQSWDLAGLQFAIERGVDIIQMSRSYGIYLDPDYDMWRHQTNMELAAGIIHINSAGNDIPTPDLGPPDGSSTPIPYNIPVPANCPSPWRHPAQILFPNPINYGLGAVIAVGMVDDNDEYSIPRSQGPAGWEDVASYYNVGPFQYTHTVGDTFQDYPYDRGEEMGLLKPDISAPGFPGVTTTNLGGGYILFSETSAAAPHVSGTAALLLSARADFTPSDLAQILQETAIDVDPVSYPGKDNRTGAGRVDAYQAILEAYLFVPDEFSTIQAAINAAQNGETVRVAAGTYNESIFMKSGVNVIGAGSGSTTLIATGSKAVNFYNVSDCWFEGFTIQNANYGAYLNGASNIILFNNTFVSTSNKPYGIRANNSSGLSLNTNTITGYSYGIILSSCTGTLSIYNNTISGYSKGISLSNSSPTITNNTLDGGGWGISATNSSDPFLIYGDNQISNNSEGVHCSSNSEPYLDIDHYANCITNNSSYHIYAAYNVDDIFARLNYWGAPPEPIASKFLHAGAGKSIFYTPSESFCFASLPKSAAQVSPPSSIITRVGHESAPLNLISTASADSTARAHNRKGRGLFYEGKRLQASPASQRAKYLQAVAEFQLVINKFPKSPTALFSLDHLVTAYWALGQADESRSYLEQLAGLHSTSLLGGFALERTLPNLIADRDFNAAVSRIKDLRVRFPATEMSKNLLFQLGEIYKHYLADEASAKVAFEELIQNYPDDHLSDWARLELGQAPVGQGENLTFKQGENVSPISLGQNYPNPFNPSTQIRFSLKEAAVVKFVIYNVLGQEVRVLIDSQFKGAGEYLVNWDSKDHSGREVGNGVYVYQITANNFMLTKKLLLIR